MSSPKPKVTQQKKAKIIAERSDIKATAGGRASRAKAIGNVGPQSPLWQGGLKAAGQDVIAAGTKLDDDDAKITQIEIQLGAAKSAKANDEVIFDNKFEIFVTNVEDTVSTPKEMQDLGLEPLVGKKYSLSTPLDLSAKGDPVTRMVSVRVKPAPGMKRADIEISSDLSMATGVQQFPGDGLHQKMGPFPPGTYALRARHIRASERSAYTPIIQIIVK